ncbi:hypothetical protein [Vibrio sagamiensis]|uniref:DUF2946 domain-containing protein n=1 Tax=Vibrio sagamiensis NBRC 104589 TaxID=1219064 RepID=A0A511QA34_9VIBR|nr:hypothetical protein [Vibrio sagamiensis]PNQ61484.1 hypothetical protein C1141_11250 [Vibrio agarivorans]GEM74126.1 hypothetical protein VSA01S_02380 [Vibrio sagamiensis NBRC 104589]
MSPKLNSYSLMLKLSLFSWLLVSFMPVINAHSSAAGVWASLCTINGFQLVKIEDGNLQPQYSKPCPFAHFSNFHHSELPTNSLSTQQTPIPVEGYTYLSLNVRFKNPIPRAPPFDLKLNNLFRINKTIS